jgi:hypothetical protein
MQERVRGSSHPVHEQQSVPQHWRQPRYLLAQQGLLQVSVTLASARAQLLVELMALADLVGADWLINESEGAAGSTTAP